MLLTPFLISALLMAQPVAPANASQPTQRATTMTPETLTAQVRAGTSDAVATATRMGPSALPTLLKLVKDADPEVRLMALRCLDAVGGEEAIDAAIAALIDDDSQVASRAIVLLHNHPPKGKANLVFQAFSRSKEQYVRVECPKVAGRVATEADMKVWLTVLPSVTDKEVREGIQIGVARMGHQPSRDWFLPQLAAADGPKALPWLEAAEYMHDKWVLPSLLKLLDRKTAVYTVSPDFKPENVRVCDLAAYCVFVVTDSKPPFPVSKRRYLETEIDEARKLAAQK